MDRHEALLVLSVSLFCWGVWPTLRQKCGAPIAAFATLNICSQFCTAWVYFVALSSAHSRQQMVTALTEPGLREGALVLGGFLLGHGDQLSALAMGYLPAGIAYPLYAGLSLVLAQFFNYLQTGSEDPLMLFIGMGGVALGLVFLTLTQSAKEERPFVPRRRGASAAGAAGLESSFLSVQVASPARGSIQSDDTPPKLRPLSSASAMMICGFAGVAGGGWSPLSTYARAGVSTAPIQDPTICIVVFQIGQLVSKTGAFCIKK